MANSGSTASPEPGHRAAAARLSPETRQQVSAVSGLAPDEACRHLELGFAGLTQEEAESRLKAYGPNLVARESKPSIGQEIWVRCKNPLNALLLALAAISYFSGDARSAIVIALMVLLAVGTAFVQEHRSNEAAARLRAMVKTTASVRRRGSAGGGDFAEVPLETLVPGDVVRLSAGDMIPADLRLLEAKDLFINQSTLTGEAMPAEKFAHACEEHPDSPFDLPNICCMGANVVSGYGMGVIVRTGARTFFGELADEIAGRRVPTAFDQGIDRFTWLMLKFIVVMVPAVFLINGLTKHDWLEALLFAVAVAVGLTPEMLPMIVTVNLAKGALAMSRAKVIVKRLNAIQNFGAMDVLCADKTGTLTQDRIILKRHLDIRGEELERVLQYAYLNSHFQSGLKNLLDVAVLQHVEMRKTLGVDEGFAKVERDSIRFLAPAAVGGGVARGRQARSDQQGRGGGDVRGLHALRGRRHHGSARRQPFCDRKGTDGRAQLGRIPRGGRGLQGDVRPQGHLRDRRRERSDTVGLYRLPRPAEGERRGRHRRAGGQGRGGQDPHRRQRYRHPQNLP